jgi:uncharacterized protein (DUF58 family)
LSAVLDNAEPLVSAAEVAQIELYILRRMRELTAGDHASVNSGSGFNLLGLRDWEPGDAVSSIDWAQSSLSNFSPMITRQFEQDGNATIMAVVDASLSTRCGVRGTPPMAAIARALAAVGFAASFFQDRFGFVSFDDSAAPLAAARPRVGKSHVVHCLELYQHSADAVPDASHGDVIVALSGTLRRTSLIPVISDFLFEDANRILDELGSLNTMHDVLLLMVDLRFAYELPPTSAGWIEVFDVETGRTRVLSHRELKKLAAHVGEWQDRVAARARDAGLDIVKVSPDRWELENALLQLVAERRLRKVRQ